MFAMKNILLTRHVRHQTENKIYTFTCFHCVVYPVTRTLYYCHIMALNRKDCFIYEKSRKIIGCWHCIVLEHNTLGKRLLINSRVMHLQFYVGWFWFPCFIYF